MLGLGRNPDDERRDSSADPPRSRAARRLEEHPAEVSPSSPASAVFFLWTGHSGLDADANRGRAVLEIRHPGTTTERRGVAGLI